MTQQFQPQPDVRRHFLITGTYSSDGYVNVRDFQSAIEKVLMRSFAEPLKIMAYNTPRFHHPYAVDLREQYLKLTPGEMSSLTEQFPGLVTSLITFFKGAFEHENHTPALVVEEAQDSSSPFGVSDR